MNKIIFLDFDGVLNTEYYQNLLRYKGKAWQDEHGAFFDPEAVAQLKRIIDVTRADIVIESSWKFLGLEAMQEMWQVRSMPGRVIDITPSSISDSWLLTANLDDIASAMEHCKGTEIASWLADNAAKDTRYVIIDDEYVILDSQQPNFIMTNPYDGITEDVADRAISVLNF
ncbi:MAG: HAD domain-containing protein [Prevotella sp.]|nr:HAD domain-containing protein [Prevotella sp.]